MVRMMSRNAILLLMKCTCRIVLVILGLLGLMPLNSWAQADLPPPQSASAGVQSLPLSQAELDQLTAPIALYSDSLLGPILTAATYPLEIVEAHRWLQDPANAALRGDALATALQQQAWDLSVKSLIPIPRVLEEMDTNLEWTEQLGDAFLAQQGAVMDSIQRLRHKATAVGSLSSNPQQTVTTDDQDIEIAPADAGVVYVPYFDPNVIYGPWPWADLPPMYFEPPAGMILGDGMWIGYGSGFPILASYWGWGSWNWPQHSFGWAPGRVPGRNGSWVHNPVHRWGVPYRDSGVAARFEAQSESARRTVRGYPAVVPPREAPARSESPGVRSAPPAFESYGGGPRVREESARGAVSRSAPVSTPRAAPSSRGGGGGGGGGRPH
jgi:hypothetical protein